MKCLGKRNFPQFRWCQTINVTDTELLGLEGTTTILQSSPLSRAGPTSLGYQGWGPVGFCRCSVYHLQKSSFLFYHGPKKPTSFESPFPKVSPSTSPVYLPVPVWVSLQSLLRCLYAIVCSSMCLAQPFSGFSALVLIQFCLCS